MDETPRITRIEAQKKRADRVSIYLDGEFAFGLSHEVLVRFGLAKGDVLLPERLAEIQAAESVQTAKAKALALISYRPRSTAEIRQRLKEKDFLPQAIDQAVEDLTRVGLLNDRQFAESFIRTRQLQRPSGARLLRLELRQKGVAEADIDAALDATLAEGDEEAAIRELAEKRRSQLPPDPRKAKKRLADYLLRRGFAWDAIRPVIDDFFKAGEKFY